MDYYSFERLNSWKCHFIENILLHRLFNPSNYLPNSLTLLAKLSNHSYLGILYELR